MIQAVASRSAAAPIDEPTAFEIGARTADGSARCGRLATAHGVVETPAFMPVATQGTVKGLTPAQLRELGAQMILCNAYHLLLRPGPEVVESQGGLHRFMGWPGPILTDSGGFQILSLAPLRKVSDQGVDFRSHLDGSRISLSPEAVVRLQVRLGVDVLMPLDECLGAEAERRDVEVAAERPLAWAQRSLQEPRPPDRWLFGIVQGGLFEDLRQRHGRQLAALGFPGYAVGGLSVGEERGVTRELAAAAVEALPEERPHYLMGVGLPQDLLRFVGMGYDLFDCVMPTRNGRNGTCFTRRGRLNLRGARFARVEAPIDAECGCYACRHFSLAYLRHLARTGEMLGAQLASLHNLHFFCELMAQARQHIAAGDYRSWAADLAQSMDEGDDA